MKKSGLHGNDPTAPRPGTSYLAFASEDGPGAAARPDGEVYAGADGVERAAKVIGHGRRRH